MKVILALWGSIFVSNVLATVRTPRNQEARATINLRIDQHFTNHSQRKKRADDCSPSHTQVDGTSVCQASVIFHDSFDGKSLNKNKWSHEIFMPTEPNFEFVVFDNNPLTSSVNNGRLKIRPSLFENEFVRNGRLELTRCTGRLFTEECTKGAKTFAILPPVQSARITTKNSFKFKYGKVEVRAKLPLGDWIIPEIWLEPKRNVYGPLFASGRIRLAAARGNEDLLSVNGDKIGNNQLQSGIIMGTTEKIRGRSIVRELPEGWHADFHNYTIIWEPDNISFLVDGENRQYLMERGEKLSDLIGFEQSELVNWQHGSNIAPFDQEFYISLGLSVGGMKDFPDNSISAGHKKPWKNEAVKAMINFWQDREFWEPTWRGDNSVFEVEHVTVQAL